MLLRELYHYKYFYSSCGLSPQPVYIFTSASLLGPF